MLNVNGVNSQDPSRPSPGSLEDQVNNCGTHGKMLAGFIQKKCPESLIKY